MRVSFAHAGISKVVGLFQTRPICRILAVAAVVVGIVLLAGTAQAQTAADFQAKCSAAGVINCFAFDSASELFYNWESGTVCDTALAGKTRYTWGYERTPPGNTAATIQNGQCIFPVIDTTVSQAGGGSLKFTIPSNSDANSSGFFSEVFKRYTGGTVAYVGPGSPLGNVVYFQFYQRFDPNFLNTDFQCLGGGCGGWKQVIWFGEPPNGASSSSVEVTMNNGWERGVPQMYGQQGTDDYGVQDAAGCSYAGSGFASRANYTEPPCVRYKANQWMEFTGRIEIRGPSNAQTSRVQLWVDGKLVIDYGQARIAWGVDGNGIGQFMFTPYHTNKDPSQAHPVGYTWYDSLIISTQPIAMSTGGSSVSSPPPGAPITAFVSGFYSEVLGRAPDATGMAQWAAYLAANCNATGLDAIARGFFDSVEFRTTRPLSLSGLVQKLYVVFLGREPDAAGQAGWAALLRQARLTVALRGFIGSQEFQRLLPDRTNRTAVTALVTRFYQGILQRNPEAAGLANWVDYIVKTGDLEGATLGFLGAAEFEARPLTSRDYVAILYQVLLSRTADTQGLDAWEMILRDNLMQIIDHGFVPSPEFHSVLSTICR